MPSSGFDSRLWRAASHPGLLLWVGLQAISTPLRWIHRTKDRSRRKGHRFVREGVRHPVPVDVEATQAVLSRPGRHVVFTAPGFGEYLLARQVAEALLIRRPDLKVSYAIRDHMTIDAIRDQHSGQNVSWYPPDAYRTTLRWLASQRPDAVVSVEIYRRPILLAAAKAFGAQCFLINGRVRRRRSFETAVLSLHYRWMLRKFTAIGVQEESFRRNATHLAPNGDVRVTGDLKIAAQPAVLPPLRLTELRAWLASDLPLVAAGSTDDAQEEAMVLAAFQRVREIVPCRLLLAPRRSEGMANVRSAVCASGLSLKTRREGDPRADVFLLDTQGELVTAYEACVAAYVGGSFRPLGGGHNVVEPLARKRPVAFGTVPGNFKTIQDLAVAAGVGTRIADSEELAEFWLRYLRSGEERTKAAAGAARFIDEHGGATVRTVEMLAGHL